MPLAHLPMHHARRLRRTASVLVLLPAAAALGACGGAGPGDGERLTAGAWVERADAICLDAERAIADLEEPSRSDQEALAAYMTEVAEIGARQLDELRTLVPPAEAEVDYRALLDISEKQVGVARGIAEAAEKGDAPRVTELVAEADALQARADRIVARHRFDVCGKAGG